MRGSRVAAANKETITILAAYKNLAVAILRNEGISLYPYICVSSEDEKGNIRINLAGRDYFVCMLRLEEAVKTVLAGLADRERTVLFLRYGLRDGRPKILKEVAQELGVTKERIRQIQAKAIRKCRYSGLDSLKDFVVLTPEQRWKEQQTIVELTDLWGSAARQNRRLERVNQGLAARLEKLAAEIFDEFDKEDSVKERMIFEQAFRIVADRLPRTGQSRSPLPTLLWNTLKREQRLSLSEVRKIIEADKPGSIKFIGRKGLVFLREVLQEAERIQTASL